MSVTPQDWRVTVEVDRAVDHVTRARSSVDVDMADVLRECWLAHRAAGAAVGSWAQGALADGRTWDDVGASVELTASDLPVVQVHLSNVHEATG